MNETGTILITIFLDKFSEGGGKFPVCNNNNNKQLMTSKEIVPHFHSYQQTNITTKII